MKISKRLSFFLGILILFLCASTPAEASLVEDTIESSMREALVATGIRQDRAVEIARAYVFMGTVMISNTQPTSFEEDEIRLSQSRKAGKALGLALGNSYKVYGDKKLQETAAVIMHSARAGVLPETAAETFSSMAQNGYAFDASVTLLHEAAELVRTARLKDSGMALCKKIRKMAAAKEPIHTLKKEIILTAEKETTKQHDFMVQNAKQRRTRDSGGGAMSRSDGSGGTVGRGASGSASRGGGTSSGAGNASSGGASASGSDSASGSSGGASDSGNASGSDSASGSGGNAEGGGDASGGGAEGEGGSDSGNAGSSGGGAEGGDSSSGGDAGSDGAGSGGGGADSGADGAAK